MELTGKRIAVLTEDNYQTLELWYPVIRLREAGATVTLVGREAGRVHTSENGYQAKADIGASEAKPENFDAIVIPGGYSPDRMRTNPAMVSLVKEAHKQGKVVAAICHGPWMLATTGLAKGRRLTSYSSVKDDMVNAGAKWVDEAVVNDGKVITSRTPADLGPFCKEIISALS